jgi:hypothetical protein
MTPTNKDFLNNDLLQDDFNFLDDLQMDFQRPNLPDFSIETPEAIEKSSIFDSFDEPVEPVHLPTPKQLKINTKKRKLDDFIDEKIELTNLELRAIKSECLLAQTRHKQHQDLMREKQLNDAFVKDALDGIPEYFDSLTCELWALNVSSLREISRTNIQNSIQIQEFSPPPEEEVGRAEDGRGELMPWHAIQQSQSQSTTSSKNILSRKFQKDS